MIYRTPQDYKEFPAKLSDNNTYIQQSRMSFWSKIKFKFKLWQGFTKANRRLKLTLTKKQCYYGPFKGEFGHFLAHTLPFLMYLHKNGVRINYCGLKIHEAYLVDETGGSILESFQELRDFFAEVTPNSNSARPPKDVAEEIDKFKNRAESSGVPFWNIDDDFYYWFIHRNWLDNRNIHLYDLSKVYGGGEESACAVFPRSKGAPSSHNNGDSWDYPALIKSLTSYFEKVYVVGHPSQVLNVEPINGVEMVVTSDNARILKACAASQLIITPHSGVTYIGEYLQKQVLIIYKGGQSPKNIGSINNTLRFRHNMVEKKPLHFAFSEIDILEYVSNKMYL